MFHKHTSAKLFIHNIITGTLTAVLYGRYVLLLFHWVMVAQDSIAYLRLFIATSALDKMITEVCEINDVYICWRYDIFIPRQLLQCVAYNSDAKDTSELQDLLMENDSSYIESCGFLKPACRVATAQKSVKLFAQNASLWRPSIKKSILRRPGNKWPY